jgi:hypothetical protein
MADAHEAVYAALLESGFPGTHMAYPLGEAPALPWWCYSEVSDGRLVADGENYAELPRFEVQFLQRERDPEARAAMESAIAAIGPFRRSESWSESENCLITTYDFTYTPDH